MITTFLLVVIAALCVALLAVTAANRRNRAEASMRTAVLTGRPPRAEQLELM
jgi:hypothetical protein